MVHRFWMQIGRTTGAARSGSIQVDAKRVSAGLPACGTGEHLLTRIAASTALVAGAGQTAADPVCAAINGGVQ